MLKKIAPNLLAILIVLVLTTVGTLAYFYGTADRGATITTANIGIGETSGFPLTFDNILPGESKSARVSMTNTGSAAADFYLQMIGVPTDPEETNFCNPTEVLNLRVREMTGPGTGATVVNTWYNGSICPLYPHDPSSVIPKIADDVPAGAARYYEVRLTLDPLAGNEYANANNADTAHLIAVQYDGPAPVPDPGHVYPHNPWPHGDTNYE